MPLMRAKMRVIAIQPYADGSEHLTLEAVCKNEPYDENGSDEDNTFAKFTPSANLTMLVNNPNLKEVINVDDTFYVDFTRVD